MNKSKIDRDLAILTISQFSGLDFDTTKQLLSALSDYIVNQLSNFKDVYIPNLCVFKIDNETKWRDRPICKINKSAKQRIQNSLEKKFNGDLLK